MSTIHKYTVTQNHDKSYNLLKDGYTCRCPKSTVIVPVESMHQQQFRPTQMGCSTACPMAEIIAVPIIEEKENGGRKVTDQNKLVYVIGCEAQRKEIDLQEPEEQKKPSPLINI